MTAELKTQILQKPVLAGHQCLAEYINPLVPSYKGNPLLEALPPIYEPEQVTRLLADFPAYDDEQRNWPVQVRMHCVQQINHFMQPLPYHAKLESAISRILRDGYVVRNPLSSSFSRQFSVGFQKILEAGLNEEGRNITGNRPSASGFAIIGISGVGKSTSVDRILMLYPQVIQHTQYHDRPLILKQLVWLKLECPASGSLKVLCMNFFRQVDLILGTNYYKQHVNTKSNKETLLIPMAQIASLHGLGVLIIDEIQRLKKVKNSGEKEMLEYLTELINTIGVPVIVIGTYKSTFLFESSFAEARRASGQGDHILSNFDNGIEWELFLESLWELQWTKQVCPLTEELKSVMYEESQGIPDIALKLYMNTQWEAIIDGTEKITAKRIREVSVKCLKLLRPMLQALKRGDRSAVEKYEDLKPDWLSLNDYIEKSEQKLLFAGKIAADHSRAQRRKEKGDRIVELISFAVDLGMSPENAEQLCYEVIQSSDGMADPVFMRQQVALKALGQSGSINIAENEPCKTVINMSKTKSKRTANLELLKDDPWNGVYQAIKNRTSVRWALKESNLLKPPSEELYLEG